MLAVLPLTIKLIKMKDSVIDLHLSSAYYAERKCYRVVHCIMVAWLHSNFRKIQSGEVTYEDYEKYAKSKSSASYNEESFNVFKAQEFAY